VTEPGAVRVEGPGYRDDGHDDDTAPVSFVSLLESTNNNVQQQQQQEQEVQVTAELVDLEVENQKVEERVERQVLEKLQSAEVAEVVKGFWCSRRVKLLSGFAFVLGILAILLGTTLPLTLRPDEPTLAPTAAPTSPLPGLVELLEEVSSDGGAALSTPSTPQNRALNWLAGNANLDSYSNERKIQRYSLATFYFATNGDDWVQNTGWLSDSDECVWYNRDGDWSSFCSDNGLVEALFLWNNNLNGTIPPEIALVTSLSKLCCNSGVSCSTHAPLTALNRRPLRAVSGGVQ
jgi:hypothetical protein